MQRLLRIKQLAHTYVAYPSAVHTRFEHSLGAMHVSGRMCERLGIITERNRRIVRIAVLLHDIGHGPFSHVFEKILEYTTNGKYSHEDIGKKMLENDKELSSILGKDLKSDILNLYDEEESIESQILSSSLDADKLDYLRRDTHHIGAAYGLFDFERVIRNLAVIKDGKDKYIGIEEKGKDALENYRLARYLMHSQVYEHHARLIADDMFIRAVKFAMKENIIDKDLLNPDKNLYKFLNYYRTLDDYNIQYVIMQKSKAKAKELITAIQNRQLFKRAYNIPLTSQAIPSYVKREKLSYMDEQQISKLEKKIGDEASIDPADIFVHIQSINIKLYERFEYAKSRKERPILVHRPDCTPSGMDEESPFTAEFTHVRRLYVFCPFKVRKKVAKAAESVIGIPNRYDPRKKIFP